MSREHDHFDNRRPMARIAERAAERSVQTSPCDLKVKVFPFREGVGMGNIMWGTKHPMNAGRFPSSHPAAPGWKNSDHVIGPDGKPSYSQYGRSLALDAFRALGYWASCFPEGDGITWKPERDQDDERCLTDIIETFGWTAMWGIGR